MNADPCANISTSLMVAASTPLIAEHSKTLLNCGMTNDEIRRVRLNILVEEAGTVAEVARRIGVSPAQVSQWRNASPDSKTGKPRVMQDSSARRLEERFSKPRGWMDSLPEPSLQAITHHVGRSALENRAPYVASEQDVQRAAVELGARAARLSAIWMELTEADRDRFEREIIAAAPPASKADYTSLPIPTKKSKTQKINKTL